MLFSKTAVISREEARAIALRAALRVTFAGTPVDHTAVYEKWMHPGQRRAWDSTRRFVVVLAGSQSGKTSSAPMWLHREIQRRGPGDYLAVTATYDLFKLAMLPALLDCFVVKLGIGVYRPSDRTIDIPSLNARIILRSAESDGGLESSTAKAAWLDEAGMDSYTIGTWEAILRRLSIHQGRVLLTTTLYNLGWLKAALYDRWQAGDTSIDVIQFDSTENPAFPREEFERARNSMPLWRFNMFYRGIFTRPAGLIYDCFDYAQHVIRPFAIPDAWPRFGGLDFGGVNTAAVFVAKEPTPEGASVPPRYYLYREYHAGSRTAQQHANALLDGEPSTPDFSGGSHSEGQWRMEFRNAGLPIREPRVKDVEVGIQRGYGIIKRDELRIFDTCTGLIDQLQSYSRKLDASGNPTEEIADKATYHLVDAWRYLAIRLDDKRRVGQVL